MALIVQKYGGTSVGDVQRIQQTAQRIARYCAEGNQIVVVASAMGGETNRLIALAKEVQAVPHPRELDALLTTGEQLTVTLLAMALQQLGLCAKSYTGAQLPLKTNAVFSNARIETVETAALWADLNNGCVPIVAGFQGLDPDGNLTTLGRGGSDTTAVALAAALGADACQIYTDVDGVYTTDPHLVERAQKRALLHCDEMLEMARLGSKVLQFRSVELAKNYRVALSVRSSFVEDERQRGTQLSHQPLAPMERARIAGIAFSREEAQLTIHGLPANIDASAKIFSVLADAHIEIDMLSQHTWPDQTMHLSFTLRRQQLDLALQHLTAALSACAGLRLERLAQLSKVSLVGVGLCSYPEVLKTCATTLSQAGIRVYRWTMAELKISLCVEEEQMELAVKVLHRAFELDKSIEG